MVTMEEKVNMKGPDSHPCFRVGHPGIIEGVAPLGFSKQSLSERYSEAKAVKVNEVARLTDGQLRGLRDFSKKELEAPRRQESR